MWADVECTGGIVVEKTGIYFLNIIFCGLEVYLTSHYLISRVQSSFVTCGLILAAETVTLLLHSRAHSWKVTRNQTVVNTGLLTDVHGVCNRCNITDLDRFHREDSPINVRQAQKECPNDFDRVFIMADILCLTVIRSDLLNPSLYTTFRLIKQIGILYLQLQ